MVALLALAAGTQVSQAAVYPDSYIRGLCDEEIAKIPVAQPIPQSIQPQQNVVDLQNRIYALENRVGVLENLMNQISALLTQLMGMLAKIVK